MTLVATWVRKNSTLSELVMAADSRISGFGSWDECPKVTQLARPASLIAMSGDATEAYAVLLLADSISRLHDGALSGRMDIRGFADRLTKAYQGSRDSIRGREGIPDDTTVNVVLGGWSFRRSRMEAHSIALGPEGNVRQRDLTSLLQDRFEPRVYFAGDGAKEASSRLKTLARERGLPFAIARGNLLDEEQMQEHGWTTDSFFLDWEPLEILLTMISDQSFPTVGGHPQVSRVYQYSQAESFVWRDDTGSYYGGRKILDDERFDRRVMMWNGRSAEILQ